MKILRTMLVALSLIAFCFLPACDRKENPSAKEIQFRLLSARTWQINSLQVDGKDRTLLYQGMTLTFGRDVFVCTNGKELLPASGTWFFANEEATIIETNDGLQLTVERLDETELTLSLDWDKDSFGGGKLKSLSGHHVFHFF